VALEPRAEALDALDHADFFVSRPETDVSSSPNPPAFSEGSRRVQFGARLTF
jgi:hypothetical protein